MLASVAHIAAVLIHLPDYVHYAERVQQTRLEILIEAHSADAGDNVRKHVGAGDVVCEARARLVGERSREEGFDLSLS